MQFDAYNVNFPTDCIPGNTTTGLIAASVSVFVTFIRTGNIVTLWVHHLAFQRLSQVALLVLFKYLLAVSKFLPDLEQHQPAINVCVGVTQVYLNRSSGAYQVGGTVEFYNNRDLKIFNSISNPINICTGTFDLADLNPSYDVSGFTAVWYTTV